MASYSGSLQSKKKQELQDIALALDILETGTREELQLRIKHHLSQNETNLAEDPKFVGLYGRNRKRSVQPQAATVKDDASSGSSEDHEEKVRPPARKVQRHKASRATPPPANDSINKVVAELEPADLPLPPSPIPSAVIQAASAIGRDASALVQKVRQHERSVAIEGRRLLKNTQGFLSDASNIYTITLLFELYLILQAVLPFSHLSIPLNPPYKLDDRASAIVVSIPYPTPSYVFSRGLWILLAKWSLPTLVIPQLCGALISFNVPRREVDPLTAGIVRVACSIASGWGIEAHVLDARWRVLSAGVGVAFALAETVGERRNASLFA